LVVTVIGANVALTGTVTVSEVGVAAVTVPVTAPKRTMLFEGTGLKYLPVKVTEVPIGPLAGENDVITGGPGLTTTVFDVTGVNTGLLVKVIVIDSAAS
jgi:hypothetical protein